MIKLKNIFKRATSKVKGNGNITLQNSDITVNKGMDEILELGRAGKQIEALTKLGVLQRGFGAQHPLYPYWRYDINMDEKGVSIKTVATSNESIEKYPPHGQIKLSIPDEYKWAKNLNELIRYGYENQVSIKLNSSGLKMWLGDCLVEEINNESIVEIIPERFPDPISMKFAIEDNSFSLDYLEIGLIKIEGTKLVLSNEKQLNAKVILTIIIDIADISDNKIKMRVADSYTDNVDANLKVCKFLLNSNNDVLKSLITLNNDRDFITFRQASVCSENSENLELELALLERLRAIEKYYDVIFKLPEVIYEEDIENIIILEKSIKGNPIKGTYEYLKLQLIINLNSEQLQLKTKNKSGMLTTIFDNVKIELFGQIITFKKQKINYYNAVLENEEKIKQKLELADDGDVIILKFVPENKEDKFEAYYNLE